MNFPLLTAILQSDLPCAQRMILTVLLNHEGEDGRIFPSQTTIANQAGLCERAVRDHLQELQRVHWLSKDGRHYTVTKPAENAAQNRQKMPLPPPANRQKMPDSQNGHRQEMPVKPADSSAEPAKSAENTGKICRLTTQETPNNQLKAESPRISKQRFTELESSKANAEPLPLLLATDPAFVESWKIWCRWRTNVAVHGNAKGNKTPWTVIAAKRSMSICEKLGTLRAIAAIAHCADRWDDIYEPKDEPPKTTNNHAKTTTTSRATGSANSPDRYPPPVWAKATD